MFDVCWEQFEQMKAEANHCGEGFCNPKYEISKLKQKINRLQIEIETSKSQVSFGNLTI